MSSQQFFGIASGVLFVVGFLPYIVSIVRSDTKPAKASWIIWATLDSITLAGMAVKETLNGQIIGAVTGAWIIVILALKYGKPGWTPLDKFCLLGAILGIGLWFTFRSPLLGIVTSLSVVFLGSFPTFASAWCDPSQESKIAWIIWWFSCVFALYAMPDLTWADSAQPFTFFVIESVMVYLLNRPRRKIKRVQNVRSMAV